MWQDFLSYSKASLLWTGLENCFGKVEGATTDLQLVNMVKIQFTDLTDLLPQIQELLDHIECP